VPHIRGRRRATHRPSRTWVSVIIRARNDTATIGALGRQNYDGWWEMIVVDDGTAAVTDACLTCA